MRVAEANDRSIAAQFAIMLREYTMRNGNGEDGKNRSKAKANAVDDT